MCKSRYDIKMQPLSAEETAELSVTLERLERDLSRVLEETIDNEQPVDLDQPIGRLSRIDAIQQQKMQAAGRDAQKIQLAQVRRAQQAIQEDEYGYCRRCEEPIGVRRLQIQPEAPFCIRCQSAHEQRR
jgi:DnaK suppressor protein